MRKRELGKEKYKMFSVKRQRAPGKVVLETSPVLKETKNLKKKKLAAKWNKSSGDLRARPHQV